RPGGPTNSTWSRADFRCLAAAMNTSRLAFAALWPMNSAKPVGRSETSSGSSRPASAEVSALTGEALYRVSAVRMDGQRILSVHIRLGGQYQRSGNPQYRPFD